MIGSKYLSEVVSLDMLTKDKLNIVKAPTGSGKTYFALTAIPATLTDAAHQVVYLIDTINGKEQLLRNYNARPIYRNWDVEVSEEALYFETDNRIVIITYARFGMLLEKDPDFHSYFDYIICDELHSLIKFQYYSPRPNAHSVARCGLERAVMNDRTTVIALSATPERIKEEFHTKHYEVPIDNADLIRYETKQIINYSNLEYLLTTLDPSDTGICYVSRITTMIALAEKAKESGIKAICIWSISNPDHHMNDEQLAVRRSMLNDYAIPSEYNLVFINASSETSLKIKSPVDYVIVHNTNYDTQVQVRGRVNNDLARLYLPANDLSAFTVPDEFLNRPLFSEDKKELCATINLRNPYNRPFGWPTVRDMLIDCGYDISERRIDNKRVSIIKPIDE